MKKRTYMIIKYIILAFAIIIPLLVAFLMCRYTYNRHLENYDSTYFATIKYDKKGNDKENLDEQINGLFEYNTYKYRLFDSKKIMYSEDKELATLDIYQAIEKTETNEDTYVYELYYYFVIKDVNYSNVFRLKENDDNAQIPSNVSAPDMFLQIRDADDFENDDNALKISLTDTFFDYVLIDYDLTPSKMGKQYIASYKMKASSLTSEHITISYFIDEDITKDLPDEDKVRYVYTKESPLDVDVFYVDLTENELSSFVSGFNGDAKASGYTNYIFKTYWWWEALVTIVLVGALTTVFYIVLTYNEDEKESK